jgi:hypothetical protein
MSKYIKIPGLCESFECLKSVIIREETTVRFDSVGYTKEPGNLHMYSSKTVQDIIIRYKYDET